jgi:hypothetical protein
MSISSSFEIDNSAQLAKRFARLAKTYCDDPSSAKSRAAQVPLANLFRLLEMLRYNSFADENRRGILALGDVTDPRMPRANDVWQEPIVNAMTEAIRRHFHGFTQDDAIDALQESLRELSNDGRLEANKAARTRAFFESVSEALA